MTNFIPIIFFALVLIHVLIDAYQIEKKGIYINHLVEAILYTVVCIIISGAVLFFKLSGEGELLPLIVFPVITRMAFFDGLLNLFRRKNIWYEGTKSWIDKIETAIGLPTWLFRIIYLLIYIGYLIYYLN